MSDQKIQVPNFEAPKCLEDILFNCPDEILQQEWDRRTRAREKAKTDLLVGYYKKYYDRQPEMMLFKGMDEDLIPIVEEGYRNSTYAFITINFDESKFDLPKVHKALMRKPFNYIKQWMCVYEYHTEEGHHPHIHMLIEKKPEHYARATKSKIISDFHRKFKDFVAGSEKVDVRMVRTPASKYSYILGKKKEKHKKENVTKDQAWRKSKGLADVYGSWDGIDFSNPAAIVGLVSGPPGPAQLAQEAQSTQNFIMEIVEPQDKYRDHIARQILRPEPQPKSEAEYLKMIESMTPGQRRAYCKRTDVDQYLKEMIETKCDPTEYTLPPPWEKEEEL